ncbi:GntR family transcriptional regulator [Aphanothece hegewaldii]|uniref:GntR family transcriptional regulator n=1 Tax=Aphanothece hegewaldii TaxID=1521625 RepID=UPI0015E755F1|nr:GntR family transcriptional regulator [Aphanothece hegewaldii]
MTLSPHSLPRRHSLQDQAYQALRTAILGGELEPGQRLVETQLAEKLQVSRTPIREAIRLLQQENLVTLEPSGGVRVATFTCADAIQLYDCRIGLEQLSVVDACQKITESQLQQLEGMLEQAERIVTGKPTRLSCFRQLDLDYRFHRLLAQSSGNPWLVLLLDQVFDKMLLLRIQTTRNNPTVLDIRTEHRAIYEAVRSRDPKAATEVIIAHLNASKARVIREMEQIQLESKIVQ